MWATITFNSYFCSIKLATLLFFRMTSDHDKAQEVLGRLGKASGFLSEYDRKVDIAIACEAAKETLLRGAQTFVAASGHRPMLSSKSCGGTPITVCHRSIRQQPWGKYVRSAGRTGEEFLVQNQFLRAHMGLLAGRPRSSWLSSPLFSMGRLCPPS